MKKILLKLLLIALPFIILFFICIEFIMPPIAIRSIENVLKEFSHAEEVNFTVESTPRFLVSFGRLDKAHAELKNCSIGGIPVSSQIIEFKNTELELKKFFFDGEIRFGKDDINVKSILTEQNLKDLINLKLPELKLEKFQIKDVKINPDAVRISGIYPILSREAEVNAAGVFLIKKGDLFVKMNELNINSPITRQANADLSMTEFKVLDGENLPMSLHLTRVELREGSILLEAEKFYHED